MKHMPFIVIIVEVNLSDNL